MTNGSFNRSQITLAVICAIMLVILLANIGPLFPLSSVYAQEPEQPVTVGSVSSNVLDALGVVAATSVAQAMATATPGMQVDEALAVLRSQAGQGAAQEVAQEVVGVHDNVQPTPELLMPLPTWTPVPPTPTAIVDGLNVAVTDNGVWVGPGQERLPCRGLRDGSAYNTFAEWIGRNAHLMDAIRVKCEMNGG